MGYFSLLSTKLLLRPNTEDRSTVKYLMFERSTPAVRARLSLWGLLKGVRSIHCSTLRLYTKRTERQGGFKIWEKAVFGGRSYFLPF